VVYGPVSSQVSEKRESGGKSGDSRRWFLIPKKPVFFLTGKTTSFYKS
jgi:hypothetical protein